ncbi:MAG: TolC family protein [Calditrichaeota bacterium]|nr:TolC family protein [Calditrichota bacterium]
MRSYVTLLIFLIMSTFNSLEAVPGAESDSTGLRHLIAEAIENNPDYQAAQKRASSLHASIEPAGALPDPRIGFAVANLPTNSFVFDQEPMTGKKISLMQALPFPGKLGLKSDIAEANYWQAKFQADELKNNLIRTVKKNYYQLYLIDRSIETVKKNKELLQQMKNIAETKYAVGQGLQQDVLKSHVELSKLNDKLIQLHRKRERVVFSLNKILNRPLATQISEVVLPDVDIPAVETGKLFSLAEKNRPLLKVWQKAVEQSQTGEKLAKRNYWPDFALGVAYTQRDDLANGAKMNDFLSAEISLNLPIYFFKKQKYEVQRRQFKTVSLREKFQSVKNNVQFQIEDALGEIKKFEELITLYRDGIIPQAQQSFNSALSGYQVDKVDFLTLFNNQMTLFNFELDFYRVQTGKLNAIADFEFALGVSVASLK